MGAEEGLDRGQGELGSVVHHLTDTERHLSWLSCGAPWLAAHCLCVLHCCWPEGQGVALCNPLPSCPAIPKWVEMPKDSQLEESKPGYLHCLSKASLKPTVTWYRNGVSISEVRPRGKALPLMGTSAGHLLCFSPGS